MKETKIPQVIHYCWFGHGKKPKSVTKCINSWKKYFKGYKIIEWNEENYPIDKKPLYVRQAYQHKKWAFVSDFARFDILYHHGGIYFDTDVEVIRSFDELLQCDSIMGCENDGDGSEWNKLTGIRVAPGLVLVSIPELSIYLDIIKSYENDVFCIGENVYNYETVVERVTSILFKHGLKNIKGIQTVENITIYPSEYFSPINATTREITKTSNTYSIHWYDASWFDEDMKKEQEAYLARFWGARKEEEKLRKRLERKRKSRSGIVSVFGEKNVRRVLSALRGKREN